MRRAPEVAVVAGQELSAPDRPVGPVAGTVERDADHGTFQSVLRHAGRHMGVMMLDDEDLEALPPGALEGIAAGGVVGMEVPDERFRSEVEELLVVRDRLDVGPVGFVGPEFSQVMAEEGFVPAAEREGRLEGTAQGQRPLSEVPRKGQRRRGIAAGAAKEQRLARGDPGDRVVRARADLAVVKEPKIRDLPQALERLLVILRDGKVRGIAARHVEGSSVDVAKQQVMKRRVGEQDAEQRIAGGDRARHRSARKAPQQDDGTLA